MDNKDVNKKSLNNFVNELYNLNKNSDEISENKDTGNTDMKKCGSKPPKK